jgi:hypothetical protein
MPDAIKQPRGLRSPSKAACIREDLDDTLRLQTLKTHHVMRNSSDSIWLYQHNMDNLEYLIHLHVDRPGAEDGAMTGTVLFARACKPAFALNGLFLM